MRKYKSGSKWAFWRWTETESGYLTRLFLVHTPVGTICLHWINHADREPYLHDHPVNFVSIILKGWYLENRNGTVKTRKWFNFIRGSFHDTHRIIAVKPGGVLTLCLMDPKIREWGFHIPKRRMRKGIDYPGSWVYWQAYYILQREGWIE